MSALAEPLAVAFNRSVRVNVVRLLVFDTVTLACMSTTTPAVLFP